MTVKQIGFFEVNDGHLMLTDPTYPLGVNEEGGKRMQAEVINARKGLWVAKVLQRSMDAASGIKNACVFAFHKESLENGSLDTKGFKDYARITVDSSRAGIVTAGWLLKKVYNPRLNHDKNHYAFREGIVSESGMGDGLYQTRILHDQNETVGLMLDFLPLSKAELMNGKNGLVG
ncbi:hypothetical protein [Peribacillus kribbensis]|uniref:hypothetical protein n=1 Tax=Peribacillus kribbensis TaxID=356658 RepID=UPI0004076153|nr:hypothetical protein [Peribacillus kribbensis]